ncbi:hypothetical protein ED21_30654 [Erythrobacter sp. SD-21]|nr:hypothetical protein ED21_30654 [Erythrobacter sp. SD-21]
MRTCILAGPTRTATTSLFRYFARTKGVAPSIHKETDYFLSRLIEGVECPYDRYEACFRDVSGATARLEASPLYFAFGKRAAEAIHAEAPDAHIVFTLREPTERFFSAWTMINNKRWPHVKEFEGYTAAELVDLGIEQRDAEISNFGEIDRLTLREGSYASVLREWMNIFPKEQIHVVFQDWMGNEKGQAKLRAVISSALGVTDAELPVEPLYHENKARDVKVGRLHDVAVRLNAILEPVFNRIKPARDLMRDVYYFFNEDTRELPDKATRKRVQQFYAPELQALPEVLGNLDVTDFPDWVG